jgi:hypothetical protein
VPDVLSTCLGGGNPKNIFNFFLGIISMILVPYTLMAQDGPNEEKIAVLITGWGMSSNYNFAYAWRSHDYPRIGDRTEHEGQPCKIGHSGEFPYESHLNFIPFSILFETEGRELLFDSYGVYEYDSLNKLYVSSCPDAPSLSPDQIPQDIPIVPMGEVVSSSTGELSYPPDARTGEDYLAGWFKIGNFNNPYPNGCQDLKDEGPITYIRIFGMLGAELDKPDEYIPDPYSKAQDEYCELLLEDAFGDRIDVRYGYYTSAPPDTKHMTEVAEEFANEGYTKMLLARETTDHNRYANEFMTGNYIKEALCEIDKLDDMTIFQTRQIGRTPEFNAMNIRNLKPLIESHPEGSTIGMIYVTRGLTWGKDETPGWFGTTHPWSREVYHENAYLNYLSWKKALQQAFGDRYNLVFTKKDREESNLREDNFYSYGLGNDIDLKGYGGETVFYGIREVITWAVADGLEKLIIVPCHWSSDSLDPVYRMKEVNDLPIAPKEDLVAGKFDVVHCEDVDGQHVACDDPAAVVEITTGGSYSHHPEEFGTSYYVVLRGTLERFGLYPAGKKPVIGASQPVTKRAGGIVEVTSSSPIQGAKIEIPEDPYPDRPEGFTYETAIAINNPNDTNDCMWDDTHQASPPPMSVADPVGPAVHFGPYRTFFNRDVTITIPYEDAIAGGKNAAAVYIYNHVTEDWDPIEIESLDSASKLVTFRTQVLGLFRVAAKACPVEQLYGQGSDQVKLLRNFRDRVLSTTGEGQALTELYYEWSPTIVKLMQEDGAFKTQLQGLIEGYLPLLQPLVQ